ncbi:hypothetical protein [Streptomyces acidiscabies]|uniref:hypothetical protein n=1 Tax=Streptomyces acidiscabies TaxID=42234 RepID=UPI0038F72047
MIRIISAETKRFYEGKVEEAGQVPGLEYELKEARGDADMWKAQSDDYKQQLDQERELTAELTKETRELRACLDGQQDEFTRQLREASEPVAALVTDLIHRAEHPIEGADFRKELALRVVERWTERLTPEEHNDPLGLILRIITNTWKPGEVMDAALLQGPEPFPGIG